MTNTQWILTSESFGCPEFNERRFSATTLYERHTAMEWWTSLWNEKFVSNVSESNSALLFPVSFWISGSYILYRVLQFLTRYQDGLDHCGVQFSMSDFRTSTKSIINSQEHKSFTFLSFSTVFLQNICFGTSRGLRISHFNANASSARVLPAYFCSFIWPLINSPNILCIFHWSFLARGSIHPAEKSIFINASLLTVLSELVALNHLSWWTILRKSPAV